MLVSIFGRQSQAYEVHLLVPLVKGAMAMEIFRRLSQLSQFTANAQDPGRIIGMLSQDLNLIESKLLFLFIGCTAPLFLVASLILLGIRLGWPGILCPLIILVLAPLQTAVSRANSRILREINRDKDRRVKLITEIIEGIHFIKVQCWEPVFGRIVQQVRQKEVANYLKLALGKGVERALPLSVFPVSCFLSFLVVRFAEQGIPLTTVVIFSALEIVNSLRYYMLHFGQAIGFSFDAVVILERFCTILNTPNIQMIQIDPSTKKPIIYS